ncbi:MAG TPA: hypothetical protein VI756_20525 [Blastocatellia bacterium]
MSERACYRFRIEGVPELWLRRTAAGPNQEDDKELYVCRPAVLVECTLNFRSLRAGLNHSEDRRFAAWIPEHGLAIDWDTPAAAINDGFRIDGIGDSLAEYPEGVYHATRDTLVQFQEELIDKLVRNERLKVFSSPEFDIFSTPGDELEDFLSLVADAALRRVEPELKNLRRKFELQLEQIREAQQRKGLRAEELGVDRLLLSNLQLFESENRLASIFSTLAGTVFGTTEPRRPNEEDDLLDSDLTEDLQRMEQEASDALRSLYDEYMMLANEYDTFEIGLQADNIQVLRLALLWAPAEE